MRAWAENGTAAPMPMTRNEMIAIAERDVNANLGGTTLLCLAACRSDFELMRAVLLIGADVHLDANCNGTGRTAWQIVDEDWRKRRPDRMASRERCLRLLRECGDCSERRDAGEGPSQQERGRR